MTGQAHANEEPEGFIVEDVTDDDAPSQGKGLWTRINDGLGAGVRLSVILGAMFAAFQYYASVEREKTQRAFELVDLWESERMQNSQALLKEKLEAFQQEAQLMLGVDGVPKDPAFTRNLIAARLLEEARADKELSRAYSAIVYFLNRVSNCATSELCDDIVLRDFFFDYARQFWNYFGEALASEFDRGRHPIGIYVSSIESH